MGVKSAVGGADHPGAMSSRRPRSLPNTPPAEPARTDGAGLGADRCARLERLLALALRSRAGARTELQRTRERLRTAGDDFVHAFEAIDARTDAAVAAAELRGILCHDLDMETMLTVATEHLLARFRPANVAIWLCNGRGDHAVAAYGASDVSRAQAEATLSILGRETCPLLGNEPVASTFEAAIEAVRVPPPGGGALVGRRAIMAPLVHRGERFGALMLLQERSQAWPASGPDLAAAVGAILGEHIDRISRIVVQRRGTWPGTDSGD